MFVVVKMKPSRARHQGCLCGVREQLCLAPNNEKASDLWPTFPCSYLLRAQQCVHYWLTSGHPRPITAPSPVFILHQQHVYITYHDHSWVPCFVYLSVSLTITVLVCTSETRFSGLWANPGLKGRTNQTKSQNYDGYTFWCKFTPSSPWNQGNGTKIWISSPAPNPGGKSGRWRINLISTQKITTRNFGFISLGYVLNIMRWATCMWWKLGAVKQRQAGLKTLNPATTRRLQDLPPGTFSFFHTNL